MYSTSNVLFLFGVFFGNYFMFILTLNYFCYKTSKKKKKENHVRKYLFNSILQNMKKIFIFQYWMLNIFSFKSI
jgi:Sec-independent protein secretion pathway component TatC